MPCYNSRMALLIDGYNLLHVSDIFAAEGAGTELHRSRLALLDFLAATIAARELKQTTIVFDAAGAPPGLPHTLSHEGMTIRFARRHSDADELIEEILDQHRAPRSLTVVSSDHRVQRAARRRGAAHVDSESWFTSLRTRRKAQKSKSNDVPAKSDAKTPSDEVSYWTGKFADGETATSDDNPFPPGYGDDLVNE
jgi:uncharacterized protein